MKRKKECRLLPHITEPLYGMKATSAQILTWPIITFNVNSVWPISNGNGVIVAVIDTGCDLNHIDIKDNIIDGFNVVDNNNYAEDRNGHGSHVAGTIGAINNSQGIVGVSPNVKIMPIKALNDNGAGSNDDVAQAIELAVEKGADIITMSLGSDYPSVLIERALLKAIQKKVAIFCAAGNSGIKHDINYPARYSETISVGAIDRNLDICQFSCTGDTLDFLAPGQDIISCVPNNGYASMTGTSMATPFAVGCASLWLSYIRKIKGNDYRPTKAEYIEHFKKHTLRLKNPQYSGMRRYEGYGIIQPTMY